MRGEGSKGLDICCMLSREKGYSRDFPQSDFGAYLLKEILWVGGILECLL